MHKMVDGIDVPLTSEEIEAKKAKDAAWAAGENERLASAQRKKRNALLAKTDYLGLSDNTMSGAMSAYRQALRDITVHANWPNLSDSDWPAEPKEAT